MSDAPVLGRSVTIQRAAEVLRVCRRTIYYWIANGKLLTVKSVNGRSQRVLIESLWYQKRTREVETQERLDHEVAAAGVPHPAAAGLRGANDLP